VASGSTKDTLKDNTYLDETLQNIRSLRYRKYRKKPWKDDHGNKTWSTWRIRAAKVVLSQAFETCMGAVIICNMGLIIHEADTDAQCYPEYAERYDECPVRSTLVRWLWQMNMALLGIYSVECCARCYVERWLYFSNVWNMIDLLTVILGWGGTLLEGMVNVSLLRMCRVVRLARAARVLISIPEFYLLITGLYSSVKAIIFGSVILMSAILVWAIIAVELLHPVNSLVDYTEQYPCDHCRDGFESVFAAGLTLFQQIVAGDAWGEISVPLVKEHPPAAFILFAILMSVSLGVMNLILAVIVERAAEAQNNDEAQKLKVKDLERTKNMEELAKLCAGLDDDGNGLMSLEEILNGFDSMDGFQRLMESMDIRREEIETIFSVLDSENTGAVPYLDFCTHLGGFRKRDPIVMHSIVKYKTMQIQSLIQKEVMGALQQQTRMLQEQYRLLANLTVLSAGANQSPNESVKGGEPTGNQVTLSRVASSLSDVGLPFPMPVGDSQSIEIFERLERRMQPLLLQAEELAREALAGRCLEPSKATARPLPGTKGPLSRCESGCLNEDILDEREELDEHWMLEDRFEDQNQRFQQRLKDADALQQRCQRIVESLTALKRGASEEDHKLSIGDVSDVK